LLPIATSFTRLIHIESQGKRERFRSVLIRMFTNFGRDIVFSADLCYHETNEKPPSEREGDRVSGGRSLRDFRFVLTSW